MTGRRRAASERPADIGAIADRLHSAAIHLLTRVRREDATTGVSPARLSALSVLVFAGPMTVGQLARFERVRSPTMTRIVAALARASLVERGRSETDARVSLLAATERGRALIGAARQRRLAVISDALADLDADDLAAVGRAATLVDALFVPLPTDDSADER